MVNLDNYEECDPEHPAACRAVVGKAIYTRWDHEVEGTEEWSYGGLPLMTRGGLCMLEATFYKPREFGQPANSCNIEAFGQPWLYCEKGVYALVVNNTDRAINTTVTIKELTND